MIVGIVQARTSSTRLPDKILIQLHGKTILEHVIDRTRATPSLNEVVLATTKNRSDDRVVQLAETLGIGVYRGSVQDVLSRFYYCAKKFKAEIIARITADDPLKDPEIIEQAITLLVRDNFDYVSNTIEPTFPEGLDIEVFRLNALERAFREATLSSEREHVTPYIWKNPHIFSVCNFRSDEDLSSWRWTLDYPEDFALIKAIYDMFYNKGEIFSYKKVVEWIKENPEMLNKNIHILRNEGYIKSLRYDNKGES